MYSFSYVLGWCLEEERSSIKTPAIPSFYMIITDNQSTKLVYNLVYRKDRGPRLERRGASIELAFALNFTMQMTAFLRSGKMRLHLASFRSGSFLKRSN